MLEIAFVWKGLFLIAVIAVAFVAQSLANKGINRILQTGNVPQGSILINLVRALIWSLALLLVLEPVFGVQPTAFVTALGVSTIALSFGLQTTISNVISGIGLMVGHIIEVGEWIEVGGYQGIVTDITWRSTTLLSLIGDVIVIPNSVLNTTTLRKLSPLSAFTVTIPLEISADADIADVERDIRTSVEEAVAEWKDPKLAIDLIQQGYIDFGFKLDVRVPLRTMDYAFKARSAIVAACAGKSWLVRWEDHAG